MAVRCVIVGLL